MRCIIQSFQQVTVKNAAGEHTAQHGVGHSGFIRGLMRSPGRTVALILILASSVAMTAESVRSLYNKGLKAEARQDYEAAYNYYKTAYEKRPEDLRYKVPYERTR